MDGAVVHVLHECHTRCVTKLHVCHACQVMDQSRHRSELSTVPRFTWPLLTELKLWRQKAWPGSNKPKNATYFLHFSKAGGTSVGKNKII